MFERFTVGAREAISLAQEEARTLHHRSIGTEHILLGLLRETDGLAAQALQSQGLWIDRARAAVVAGEGGSEAIGFRVLIDVGADPEEVRSILLELLGTRPERRALPHAPDVAAALARAAEAAREEGADHVELRHLRQVLEGP